MGSLTRQLENKEGAVWQFLAGHLHPAGVKAIRLEARPQLAEAHTTLSAQIPSWEHGLVGTAFDYRLRYTLAITPADQLVAALGVRWLAKPSLTLDDLDVDRQAIYRFVDVPRPKGLVDVARGFMEELDAAVSALNPVRRRLDRANEERLASYCLVLAYLEQIHRSGVLGERSPLIYPSPCANVNELLARAQVAWVEDLCAMASTFHDVAERHSLFDVPYVLNPTFDGSADMKADADVILGGCLLDVKCTVKPSLSLDSLAQLLGYVLLDYSDAFGINSVGFYFARQGLLFQWPLGRLLGRDVSKLERSQLREEFRRVLRAPAPAARPARPRS